ncbi:DUF4190 domain-containing protein [Cellulomonas sp. URHB0016]
MPDLPLPPPGAPRSYRDTDPVAIWGFVLTFLCWPLGLLLSFVALRRVRRTGHGGWGLAVAGATLSTIAAVATALAGAVLVARTDLPQQWVARSAAHGDVTAAERVARDVAEDLTARHEKNGEWPHDAGHRVVGDVRVDAYRTDDELCVDASRGDHEVSIVDGDVRPGMGCPDRGFAQSFRAAHDEDVAAYERDRQAALVDQLRARAAIVADRSSLGGKPQLGLLHVDRADLEVCSAVVVTWDHIDDVRAREALFRLLQQVDGYVAMTTYTDDFEEYQPHDPSWDPFARTLLYLEADCWRGGFVGPDGPATGLPARWTVPLTQEAIDADKALVAATRTGDPAAVARSEALHDEEESQIAAAIAART